MEDRAEADQKLMDIEIKDLRLQLSATTKEQDSSYQQLSDRLRETKMECDKLNRRVLDVEDENSDLKDKIRSMVGLADGGRRG